MRIKQFLLGAGMLASTILSSISAQDKITADHERPNLPEVSIIESNKFHNHSSCIIECPNKDLLVCWYSGSGEKSNDDLKILGSRKKYGSKEWEKPFVMADIEGFPDCNPIMMVNRNSELSLIWPTLIANQWYTALLNQLTSSDYQTSGTPKWSMHKNIILKPDNLESKVGGYYGPTSEETKRARDKYFRRLGWMPRNHPIRLTSGRILLPLYSDGFDFSLMAISDDEGKTWGASDPIIGDGPIQPTLVERKDKSIVAYLRDSGKEANRVMISISRDKGESWSIAADTDIPNPNSSLEVLKRSNNHWIMAYNNSTEGDQDRRTLAVSISDDEGKTWGHTRIIERNLIEKKCSFSYPSLIEGSDGYIHLTFTYKAGFRDGKSSAIKYLKFNEQWIKEGDGNFHSAR